MVKVEHSGHNCRSVRVQSALQFKVDSDQAVGLDHRYDPVLIATWFGAPTRSLVGAFFSWLRDHVEQQKRSNGAVILITDALDAKLPTASVRQAIASATLSLTDDIEKGYALGNYTVLASPLLRGGLTALGWLNPRLKRKTASSTGEALRKALADLAAAGHSAPASLDPNTYVRPAWPPLDSVA